VYSEDIKRNVCPKYQNKKEDMYEISYRMAYDSNRIKVTCTKYLGTLIPWKPLNSVKDEDKWNYYHDKERKIGWCFNPKVRNYTQLMP